MCLRGGFAKLAHLAEDGVALPGRRNACKGFEGVLHGLGIRVVGVVDQQDIVREGARLHAPRNTFVPSKAVSYGFKAHTCG